MELQEHQADLITVCEEPVAAGMLTTSLEEVSRLLNAYLRTILASDSWLPYLEGISRAKPLPS